MVHIDHFCYGTRNLYEGCHRFREESGLDNYDGGWFRGTGIANRIVPLGRDTYIEIESAISHYEATQDSPTNWFEEATRNGEERWMFWCLRSDTLDELKAIAQRLGGTAKLMDTGRTRPDGSYTVRAWSAPFIDGMWRGGLPNWYWFEDMNLHPSRQTGANHRVAPDGVAWLELGTDRTKLRDWVGPETFDRLPLRFIDGEPGLHALAIRKADGGEIVVRCQPGASFA